MKPAHEVLNTVICGGNLCDSGCDFYQCGCVIHGRSQCTPGMRLSPQTILQAFPRYSLVPVACEVIITARGSEARMIFTENYQKGIAFGTSLV